jgi:hypothetical protein
MEVVGDWLPARPDRDVGLRMGEVVTELAEVRLIIDRCEKPGQL